MYNWFLVKVKYEKVVEEGKVQKISEQYLFDALSFTEAETRVNEELKPFIAGEFITAAITRARINELFTNENGDTWFKCKAFFISMDEEKGVEKRTGSTMMVKANDVKDAWDNLHIGMKGTMANFEVSGINETQILDVYPYIAPEEKEDGKE